MTPPDPALSALQKAGRKMTAFHGQADPVFSINNTIDCYEKLNTSAAGKASDFARLFALPGVAHCGGGIGLERSTRSKPSRSPHWSAPDQHGPPRRRCRRYSKD
jgi:hypothetical protein